METQRIDVWLVCKDRSGPIAWRVSRVQDQSASAAVRGPLGVTRSSPHEFETSQCTLVYVKVDDKDPANAGVVASPRSGHGEIVEDSETRAK